MFRFLQDHHHHHHHHHHQRVYTSSNNVQNSKTVINSYTVEPLITDTLINEHLQ
jgi:hypothetical protein